MTPHRPGPRQRAILAAMRAGALLCRRETARGWYFYLEGQRSCSPRSCVALHVHGYIMFDRWEHCRGVYALTERGRVAV